jgi:hypothetical protein
MAEQSGDDGDFVVVQFKDIGEAQGGFDDLAGIEKTDGG